MSKSNKNVSELIRNQAKQHPDKKSIVFARKNIFGVHKYPFYTFTQLEGRINQICHKLVELGVTPGHRVLFFVKPNLDFCVITFALFRLGAIPVFIDPGMKREYFLNTIKEVEPDVLIGIPKVHILKKLKAQYFSSIKIHISTGPLSGPNTKSIYRGLKKLSTEFDIYRPHDGDLAAILYTSGGTGEPKGVEYTHDIFINQTKMLQKEFNLDHHDIDVPGFPLFSFFTLAMGMTSVIPNMDFSNPSACNPAILYKNIQDSKATFLAGSPAIWERLADYCLEKKVSLDTVKYVVMFGAPVNLNIHKKFEKILPLGTTYTPYGATECLPVSNVSGAFLLSTVAKEMLAGKGTCVGKPMGKNQVKIIMPTDDSITSIQEITELEPGQVGEIIVKGKNVTKGYYNKEEATESSKIADTKGPWHRMGDVGYLDESGLLWFCGRKKHVVYVDEGPMYPVPVESVFNQHPKIKRTALVKNIKTNRPVVLIERHDQKTQIEPMFLMDLKNLSQTHMHTKTIQDFQAVLSFPVDIRHNIKIDRTELQKKHLG